MPWAGSEGSEAQPRKYNGKEWVEAFGYDNYLYGARDYYAAIGRFTVIDPLAYKTPHISPYAYCANNPIKYIDPDGREIYRYDRESGNFSMYQKTDDPYDQIGKFSNNDTGEWELDLDEEGQIQTYSDHLGNSDKIAKGILRNGLNIKRSGAYINIFQFDWLTREDIYNFALILDEVTGVEISGFISSPFGKEQAYFEAYKNNTIGESSNLLKAYPNSIIIHFHTHGHASNEYHAQIVSKEDRKFRRKIKRLHPNVQLLILHNYGTHQYIYNQ